MISRVVRGIGRAARWTGRRVAIRSRWLSQRLWLIAAAEGAWMVRRHWKRLDPPERERLVALARKSRGRPTRLSGSEREELDQLLDKLGHAELAGGLVALVVPFRFVGSLTERLVGRRSGSAG